MLERQKCEYGLLTKNKVNMTREEMQLLRAVLENLEGNLQECVKECIEELGYINLKWVREELFGSDFEAGRNFVHCLVPLSDTTDAEDTLVKELSRVGVFKFVM